MGFSLQCYFATLADHKEPVLPAFAVNFKMAALKNVSQIFFSLSGKISSNLDFGAVGPLSSYYFCTLFLF